MFNKENYSKEAFEKASFEAEEAKEKEKKDEAYYEANKERLDIYYVHRSAPAIKRLKKMNEAGEKEAYALNEQYNDLYRKAKEAIKSLSDFERDKLGMHEDLEKEKEERTMKKLSENA